MCVAVLLLSGCQARINALDGKVNALSVRVDKLEAAKPSLAPVPVQPRSASLTDDFAAEVEHDPELSGYPRMLGIPMSKIIGPDGRVIDPVDLANRIRTVYVKESPRGHAFDMLCGTYGNEIGAAIYYGRIGK